MRLLIRFAKFTPRSIYGSYGESFDKNFKSRKISP